MMHPFLMVALLLSVYMSCWFVVSCIARRNDVADVAWGLGFVLVGWSSLIFAAPVGGRELLVAGLVTLWGIRLAWHIHARNKGKTEDARYAAWRKEWGKWFLLRSFFQVYLLQGFLLYLIAVPVVWVMQAAPVALTFWDGIGIAIWLLGFSFEATSDWQLARFLKNSDNKGKLMQTGLFAYSRHPNYFGEVTLWWGIWLLALPLPFGWATVVGPLTITFLILGVSGVPMLERSMAKHPEFAVYKARVSGFFPWPPRKRT